MKKYVQLYIPVLLIGFIVVSTYSCAKRFVPPKNHRGNLVVVMMTNSNTCSGKTIESAKQAIDKVLKKDALTPIYVDEDTQINLAEECLENKLKLAINPVCECSNEVCILSTNLFDCGYLRFSRSEQTSSDISAKEAYEAFERLTEELLEFGKLNEKNRVEEILNEKAFE